MNPSKIKTWLVRYGIGSGLAMLIGWLAYNFTAFKPYVIYPSYDLPFLARPDLKVDEAVMVLMDDASHEELHQPYTGPWDRAMHAKLLDRLTADGARAVVFDILFTDTNTLHPEGDAEFTRAIKANGKVILGVEFYYNQGLPTVTPPLDQFVDAAADWGIVQLDENDDLTVRRALHTPADTNADNFSSLSWQTAHLLGVAGTEEPTNRTIQRWNNYYGPPEDPTKPGTGAIPQVSFYLALTTNEMCPAGFFSNKVVFVGGNVKTAYSGQRKDEYRTPYTLYKRQFVPGVEIQTTQFLNLLRHDWLTIPDQDLLGVAILLTGLFLGVVLAGLQPLKATGLGLLMAVGVVYFEYYLYSRHRIWFPWLIIVGLQLPVALLWSILYNSLSAYIQNRLLEQSLGLYLSPKQVQRILKEPGLRQPGGSKQVVSILFSDIAGFSRISEQLDPQDLVLLLNSYYETTIRCIHQMDGTIVDIIGDAIFAIWNAPELQPDHQERMLKAALMFQKNVKQFNGKQGSFALQTRVGLHTGEVVVGNVGSTEHFDYAAIGDNVNLASRLEGLNKQLDTNVLLTRVAIPPTPGDWVLRPVGFFQFKGMENFVEVVELVVNAGSAEESRPWREAFAAALAEFGKKHFDTAEAGFKRVLELRPNDGPANFYLKQIADLRTHELPENWKGEVSLREK